jgi:hypothetical protein
MDADLQQPPAAIPALLAALDFTHFLASECST